MIDVITEAGPSIAPLIEALSLARPQFRAVHKDATNPHLHNSYATLGEVLDAVTDALLDQGLTVVQTPVPLGGGDWAMQTTLWHVSGASLSGLFPMHIEPANKGVNASQAAGSGSSYARRYGLMALLCLSAEDDDGCAAGPNGYQRQAEDRHERRPAPARNDRPPARSNNNGYRDGYRNGEGRRSQAASSRAGGRPPLPDHAPRSGRELWSVLAEQAPAVKDEVIAEGTNRGFPRKMVDWSGGHVAELWPIAVEVAEQVRLSDRERN